MQGDVADAALVARARAGSDRAFAQLVDRHQQSVRNFLRKIVPYADEADDIAQETFLAAWSSLRKLKSDEKFLTWTMSIAWRKAKGQARSAVRARNRDGAWRATQPEQTGNGAEMTLALNQALDQLSVEQRAAVSLCLGVGWSHGDAAEALNMPLGTVKSHVSRGRARLVEILGVNDE